MLQTAHREKGQPAYWMTRAGWVAVLLLAVGVRVYGLADEDYWLDELHSMANSAARRAEFESLPNGVILTSFPRTTELTPASSLGAVWRGMEDDSHPPTYFVLLRLWRGLFGDGEGAVRLLPVLFSILSIVPVALMLREYGRPRLGLVVGGMLAVAFAHIHMAQENRPYSLGLLLVSLSYWALVRMEVGWAQWSERRRWFWIVMYGAAVYFALLTHYFTALALAGQVAFVAARVRGSLLRAWSGVVVVAVGAFAVTWLPQFLGQLDFIAQQDWLLEERADHTLRTALRLADLPIRLLFAHERFQFHTWAAGAGVLLLGAALWNLRRVRADHAVVFVCWYVVPVAFFVAFDLAAEKQTLSHLRYSSVALPGLVGLIVLAAQHVPKVFRRALFTLLLASLALTWTLPTQTNPRSRRAAEFIADKIQPGDLLIYDAIDWPPFWAARIYQTVSYYLPEYLPAPSPSFVVLRESPDAELLQGISGYGRLLVVSPRVDEVPNPMPERYHLAGNTGYLRGIGVVHLFVRAGEKGQTEPRP